MFLDKALATHGHSLKRVWVSGPPAMNETFDKYFTAAKRDYTYEIM